MMSIGAIKAFEIGDGVQVSTANGSSNNDFFLSENGKIGKKTNHAGGILGGISDGSEIVLRAYVKPTPSIFQEQETVNRNGENIHIQIHDPIIVPRAVVVVEAMTALTLADAMIGNMSSRISYLKDFYKT